MLTNVGVLDRFLRVVLGFALLSLLFLFHGDARWIGLLGLLPLLTGLVGHCPGYALLEFSTRRVKHS